MQYNSNTSTELSRYTFPETEQDVRTLQIDGEPWFVAKDAADILGYANAGQVTRWLDDDEYVTRKYSDVFPGHAANALTASRRITLVNEPGLYSMILRSERPEAKAFKRWVTHEVLPSIRKTGSYSVQQQIPQTYAEALRAYADEVEAREAAQAQVKVLEPKAEAWQTLASAEGDYDVKRVADILSRDHSIEIGRNRLFAWLREMRYITEDNRPYKKYGEYFVERMSSFQMPSGERVLKSQLRVTPAGVEFIYKKIKAQRAIVVR